MISKKTVANANQETPVKEGAITNDFVLRKSSKGGLKHTQDF